MDTGRQLFPYERSLSQNIDYGCINPSTIAQSGNFICWVSKNEKSGVSIVYSKGANANRISTDGIDFKLENLTAPEQCYGFMARIAGHTLYVVTWTVDNLTYAYDFNTERFYTLSDEYMDAFIVKKITFFNNKYYFVSIRDGNLYELNANFSTYDYGDKVVEIPYIRVCESIELADQSRFAVGYLDSFVEQGNINYKLPP